MDRHSIRGSDQRLEPSEHQGCTCGVLRWMCRFGMFVMHWIYPLGPAPLHGQIDSNAARMIEMPANASTALPDDSSRARSPRFELPDGFVPPEESELLDGSETPEGFLFRRPRERPLDLGDSITVLNALDREKTWLTTERARGLEDALSDPDAGVRDVASKNLSGQSTAGLANLTIEIRDELFPYVIDPTIDLREATSEDSLPSVAELIRSREGSTRACLLVAISRMGAPRAKLKSQLVPLLNDCEPLVRLLTARTLLASGSSSPRCKELLETESSALALSIAGMPDDLIVTRSEAVHAFVTLSAHTQILHPQLREMMSDGEFVFVAARGLLPSASEELIERLPELITPSTWNNEAAGSLVAAILKESPAKIHSVIKFALQLESLDEAARRRGPALSGPGRARQPAPPEDIVSQVALLLNSDRVLMRHIGHAALLALSATPKDHTANVIGLIDGYHNRVDSPNTLDAAREFLAKQPCELQTIASLLTISHRFAHLHKDATPLAYECGGRSKIPGTGKTVSDVVFWLAKRSTEPDEIRSRLSDRDRNADDWMDLLGAFEAVWNVTTEKEDKRLRRQISRRVSMIANVADWEDQHLDELLAWSERLRDGHQATSLAIDGIVQQTRYAAQKRRMIACAAGVIVSHVLFWAGLVFLYPRSPRVQSLFFWNPWVRRVAGFGYVGIAIAWTPPLRRIVFAPFRKALLADARLDELRDDGFFPGINAVDEQSGKQAATLEWLAAIRGQVLIEGESGLGKSMLLRWHAKHSGRVAVFLSAARCHGGVVQAIEAKLEGMVSDRGFLQSLIYAGHMDIYIDGLNEVDAQTVARVCQFLEKFFHGNVILTTQPMHWVKPTSTRNLQLLPLSESQVKRFLCSRESTLPEGATLRGRHFALACEGFWNARYGCQAAKASVDLMLSNPMDLTTVAQLLAQGQPPNLQRLHEQQFHVMEAEYKRNNFGAEFPLQRFAESVFEMRINDEREFLGDEFRDELECLEKFKLALVRRDRTPDGERRRWYLRHDKVIEYFLTETFHGDLERQTKFVDDARFRGVYLRLADALELGDAENLKEILVQHAIKSNDVSVITPYVARLNLRLNRIHRDSMRSRSA